MTLQFLESFANKHISSSEDRLEETKRRKLALKAEKLVELMMVSGIPTASGYEERIRFSEMEIVERGASENGLVVNVPSGHEINGWDVNVAGVRTMSVKKHVRYHTHAVSYFDTPAYRFSGCKRIANAPKGVSYSSETGGQARDIRGTPLF